MFKNFLITCTRIRASFVKYTVAQVSKAVSVPCIYRYISRGVRKSFSISYRQKKKRRLEMKSLDHICPPTVIDTTELGPPQLGDSESLREGLFIQCWYRLTLWLTITLFWFHICWTLGFSTIPVASNSSLWQRFQCFIRSYHKTLKTYCSLPKVLYIWDIHLYPLKCLVIEYMDRAFVSINEKCQEPEEKTQDPTAHPTSPCVLKQFS